MSVDQNRRRFLEFLRNSPLYLTASAAAQNSKPIGSPSDAHNVFDFQRPAESNIQPQHWAYLQGGADDDKTVRANADAYGQIQIRARRFVDVSNIQTSVTLFNETLPHPILLSPIGSQQAFHDDGEAATARAAAATKSQMILSTNTSLPIRDIVAAKKSPFWYQLYVTNDFEVTKALIARAEQAGCTAIAITTDSPTTSNRETLNRAGRKTEQRCKVCHDSTMQGYLREHGMYEGLDGSRVTQIGAQVTWPLYERIRSLTKLKLLMKGVMTAEDAAACVKYGVDGIIVSNHGGRQEESLHSTIEALPEIAAVVAGRIPILIDGGIRRGTDIFKAFALGASAVCIGRPYIWGLGAFGQAGVERVVELLRAELAITMKLCGTPSLAAITNSHVRLRPHSPL